MSEIEKLYKNCGFIETIKHHHFSEHRVKNIPFTAEKQLLLLQWLLDRTDLYLHKHKTDFTYSIASGNIAVNRNKKFKESIAEFINNLWQSLTEEEQQQVRGILDA